jgi:hypothetical protein
MSQRLIEQKGAEGASSENRCEPQPCHLARAFARGVFGSECSMLRCREKDGKKGEVGNAFQHSRSKENGSVSGGSKGSGHSSNKRGSVFDGAHGKGVAPSSDYDKSKHSQKSSGALHEEVADGYKDAVKEEVEYLGLRFWSDPESQSLSLPREFYKVLWF